MFSLLCLNHSSSLLLNLPSSTIMSGKSVICMHPIGWHKALKACSASCTRHKLRNSDCDEQPDTRSIQFMSESWCCRARSCFQCALSRGFNWIFWCLKIFNKRAEIVCWRAAGSRGHLYQCPMGRRHLPGLSLSSLISRQLDNGWIFLVFFSNIFEDAS